MSVKHIYNKLYSRVTEDEDYTMDDREAECMMYNYLIKSLPEDQRNQVSDCLKRLINRYLMQVDCVSSKSITFKPKSFPGAFGTKTYIYDLESLPDPLGDMLILCLREYIFPQ